MGKGKIWGIDKNKVLVEFDYGYLVRFNLEEIKNYKDYREDE